MQRDLCNRKCWKQFVITLLSLNTYIKCVQQKTSLYALTRQDHHMPRRASFFCSFCSLAGKRLNIDKCSSNCGTGITVWMGMATSHSHWKLLSVGVIFIKNWLRKCLYIHQRDRFNYITRILSVKLCIFQAFFSPMGVHPLFPGGAKHKKFENQCHKLYNKLYIAMSLTISSNWWLIQGDDSGHAS